MPGVMYCVSAPSSTLIVLPGASDITSQGLNGYSSGSGQTGILDWSRSVDRGLPGAAALGKVLALAETRDDDTQSISTSSIAWSTPMAIIVTTKRPCWRLASGAISFAFQSLRQDVDQLGLLASNQAARATVKLYGASGYLLKQKPSRAMQPPRRADGAFGCAQTFRDW